MTLAERLYPEAEYQLDATRRVLANVPDGRNDFAAHPRSMPLTRLAGHTAELAGFAYFFLTRPEINMGTPDDPRKILRMATKDELLAEYDPLVTRLLETLKVTPDPAFDETFTLKRQGNLITARTRYEVYRTMFLDHMIHHRAQLGVYLRLLEQPVPATFGPTADEKSLLCLSSVGIAILARSTAGTAPTLARSTAGTAPTLVQGVNGDCNTSHGKAFFGTNRASSE